MATKPVGAAALRKYKDAPANSSSWEQATFVNRELTETEQRACKDWDMSADELMDYLSKLAEQFYKVTFRWDDYNVCYGCWLLPPKDHPDNAGLILTGRGSTALKAFKQVCYKHFVLFTEQWPTEIDRRGGREIDD